MGGGGVMKTAAKVAGIVAGGGFRGVPSITSSESIVSAVSRKVSRPVSAIVSSHEGGGEVVTHVQRPSWELEDWEFTRLEDELNLVSGDPLPRVVFGGASTMEEAKEATSELKDALEKVYSKSASESESSFTGSQTAPTWLSNSEYSEARACVRSEAAASKHAFHAFKFLSENPAAQTVVASIACDPNVWTAVMQNEELTNYLQSQKMTVSSPEENSSETEQRSFEECDHQSGTKENRFSSFVEKIRCTVVDMFDNLSGFVHNMFGGSSASEKKSDDGAFGTSILGLAVFVIMLIVFKRA